MKWQIWKNFWGGELLLTSMRVYEATEEDAFLYHLKEFDKKAGKWIYSKVLSENGTPEKIV